MAEVYLGLGSNLGNKQENLAGAIHLIAESIGKIIKASSFYSSKPWGFDSENDFLNAVIRVESCLSPASILQKAKTIERLMGRTEKTHDTYSDRIIDIDILLYDNLVLTDATLKIPHPFLQERDFVLVPITEINPHLVHPVYNKTMEQLLAEYNLNH